MYQMLKTALTTLVALTLLAASGAPALADEENDPVVTATITFPGSIGDFVLLADDDGDYTASVEIFQLVDGEWEQVEMRATLRVFEDTLEGPEDLRSVPFDSSADEAVNVTFSGDGLSGAILDVFVTFSELGQGKDGSVPTSHHHIAKNALISLGQEDLATEFNGPSHRVLAL